jgi:hypothetical protein
MAASAPERNIWGKAASIRNSRIPLLSSPAPYSLRASACGVRNLAFAGNGAILKVS